MADNTKDYSNTLFVYIDEYKDRAMDKLNNMRKSNKIDIININNVNNHLQILVAVGDPISRY